MKKKPQTAETLTREERQVAITLQSARDVLGEIETYRGVLSDERQNHQVRRDAKHDLIEASERLCNLLGLAVYQIANSPSGAFQARMKAMMDDLRSRLLDMGTSLMFEKMGRIKSRAEDVLESNSYPIGLAAKLDMAFSGILDNLKTLGAIDRLKDDQQGLLEATGKDIRSLIEIEQDLGIMREIKQSKKA